MVRLLPLSDSSIAVSLYVTAALLVTLAALVAARETAGRDLEAVAEEEGMAQEDEGPRLKREGAMEKRVRAS